MLNVRSGSPPGPRYLCVMPKLEPDTSCAILADCTAVTMIYNLPLSMFNQTIYIHAITNDPHYSGLD